MSVDLKRRGIEILGFGMAIEVVDRRRSGRVETMTKAKKRGTRDEAEKRRGLAGISISASFQGH